MNPPLDRDEHVHRTWAVGRRVGKTSESTAGAATLSILYTKSRPLSAHSTGSRLAHLVSSTLTDMHRHAAHTHGLRRSPANKSGKHVWTAPKPPNPGIRRPARQK